MRLFMPPGGCLGRRAPQDSLVGAAAALGRASVSGSVATTLAAAGLVARCRRLQHVSDQNSIRCRLN